MQFHSFTMFILLFLLSFVYDSLEYFSAAKVEFLKKVQKMPDDEIIALLAFANSLEIVKRTFTSDLPDPHNSEIE